MIGVRHHRNCRQFFPIAIFPLGEMARFWRRELFRLGKCPDFGGENFSGWGNAQILAAETFSLGEMAKFWRRRLFRSLETPNSTILAGSLAAEVPTPPTAFSSLPPASATRLRSTVPVRTATTCRPSRSRATTTRTNCTSVRAATTRAATTATAGGLFALSRGSPNSERRRFDL